MSSHDYRNVGNYSTKFKTHSRQKNLFGYHLKDQQVAQLSPLNPLKLLFQKEDLERIN